MYPRGVCLWVVVSRSGGRGALGGSGNTRAWFYTNRESGDAGDVSALPAWDYAEGGLI